MPSVPRNLQVKECSKDYIDLVWEAPETDGGSDILQYVIEKRDMTRAIGMWMVSGTVSATERYFRALKLFQGNSYQFRVSAENRVGMGPAVEMTQTVVAQLPFGQCHLITLFQLIYCQHVNLTCLNLLHKIIVQIKSYSLHVSIVSISFCFFYVIDDLLQK